MSILTIVALTGCGSSVISAVTAKSENIVMKLDEAELITSHYEIESSKVLTATEKACTYVSSNPNIVKISNKVMRAVGIGSADITITSDVDKSKSCSFTVDVKDIYFDRDNSMYDANDNLDYECPEDGGYFETNGMIQGEYYIDGVEASTWYVETDITVKSVVETEGFPKFGIITSTINHSSNGQMNKTLFFLNAEIANVGSSWNTFGVCEVSNGTNYAWNPTINDYTARHRDDSYILPNNDTISYNTKFKLGLARDGYDFHTFVNDNYAGSFTALEDLFIGFDGQPCKSIFGFFEFNSHVKFENYSYEVNETTVKQRIDSISNPTFIDTWTEDIE